MFEFCAAESCMPFHAEALKDRSLIPPVSVTMHACVLLPAFGAELAPVFDGALPRPAAANTRPLTAMTPSNFIPPAGRKMISFPLQRRRITAAPTPGAYAVPGHIHATV